MLSSWGRSGVSRREGDGGGASVCLRRLPDVETRPITFEGTLVEILVRAAELLRCLMKEAGLNLENWLSFPEAAVLGGLGARSNDSRLGEGVKAGPCSGTGTR